MTSFTTVAASLRYSASFSIPPQGFGPAWMTPRLSLRPVSRHVDISSLAVFSGADVSEERFLLHADKVAIEVHVGLF
jgi:hypothetical protein